MSAGATWKMKCVECGADEFEVQVKVFARLREDGTDIDGGDHEWDDDSACYCIECGWTGSVGQAKKAHEAAQ